jgi:hypothetical protein
LIGLARHHPSTLGRVVNVKDYHSRNDHRKRAPVCPPAPVAGEGDLESRAATSGHVDERRRDLAEPPLAENVNGKWLIPSRRGGIDCPTE